MKMDNYTAIGLAEGFVEAQSDEQVIEAWQYIYDHKLYLSLRGFFGRRVKAMLDAGVISP